MALLTREEVEDTLSMRVSDDFRRNITFSCHLCRTNIDVIDTRFAAMAMNKAFNKIAPECPICGEKMIIDRFGVF